MRACLIAHSSADEGANRVLLETIEALQERGAECLVLAPRAGQFLDLLTQRNVSYFVLKYCWWMGKGDSPLMRFRRTVRSIFITIPAIRALRKWQPDVILTNTVTVVTGAITASFLGIPHVWHLNEFGREDHDLIFDLGDRISYKLMDSLSSICIVASEAVATKYAPHLLGSKLRPIYYSMHLASRSEHGLGNAAKTSEGKCRCIIVGTLCESKGQKEAIEAISELKKDAVWAELIVVGKGEADYERYLRDLVQREELDGQISFTGQVPDGSPLMHNADMVLMCSRAEAFGRVTVEAMFAGTPVIGARSGATSELVRDGVTGLLYEYGNPCDLAKKIRYIHDNPHVAADIARNARQWAEATFSKERYGREVLEVLNSAIIRKHGKT